MPTNVPPSPSNVNPSSSNVFIHESSYIDEGAKIGKGTKIWHFSHISGKAEIGEDCKFGQNTFVADHVKIGNNCKIQNNVSIYTGVELEDNVFLGPSCVLTNVTNPRCEVNRQSEYKKTLIKNGASIGANATIVCGVTLGEYCFIAAGAVVTKDVPDFAMIAGVPGKIICWMSKEGERLEFINSNITQSGQYKYQLNGEKVTVIQ
ncbi:MAG: N-acetyltransferase [Lentisphaerales bacterium]|nr:N-acetyltransferase [Lentisphaerales bacterium]